MPAAETNEDRRHRLCCPVHASAGSRTRSTDSGTRCRSGRPAIVVDEGAEAIDSFNFPGGVGGALEGDRPVQLDAPMATRPVVVLHEVGQHELQMVATEEGCPVQALSASGLHEPLGIRRWPGANVPAILITLVAS